MDTIIAENFRNMDINKMEEDSQQGKIEACGLGGILTLMNLAKELNYSNSEILDFRNSGDVSGDYKQVVGYLSSCVYN